MVYLGIKDPIKDQHLFINSPGGWILPGLEIYDTMLLYRQMSILEIYDTMQFVPPDVHTIGIGTVVSVASFILTGGAITKRKGITLCLAALIYRKKKP